MVPGFDQFLLPLLKVGNQVPEPLVLLSQGHVLLPVKMLLFTQLPILNLEQGNLVLSLLALGKVVDELLVLFLWYFYQVGPSTGLDRNLPRVLVVAARR